MSSRSFNAPEYKYGFNGKENDNETVGTGSGTQDYGERIYNPALGKWLSIDPKSSKYPSISPYTFAVNSPIFVIDPDGGDIIVLSAPLGAMGKGHAAVLIGNDKEGWVLYSKNGTLSSGGSSGDADKHPQNGIPVGSLDNFALKYNLSEDGKESEYTSAFRITTNENQDKKMKTAAAKSVESFYDVTQNSCIDVCSDALKSVGKDEGRRRFKIGNTEIKMKTPVPNERYDGIKKYNKGTLVTNEILPSKEQVAQRKKDYANNQAIKKDILNYTGNKQGDVAPKDNTIVKPR
jgi:RHS repeat-associated protein